MQQMIEIKSHNLILRGMLHKPDNLQGKVPLAIIFHGFLGNKMGPHFIFSKLSRTLEKLGIASVRLDFGGSGESDGEFSEMTFSHEVEDARSIMEYVKSLDFVNPENINLVGLSMGGAIASIIAGEYKSSIYSLSLWAPAGNMGEVTWNYFIGNRRSEFLKNGYLDIDGLVMSKEFVQDVTELDIYKRASGFEGRVLIIHGDNDEVVPLKASIKYKELYNEKADFYILKGADHTFDKKEWEDNVIRLTTDFLCVTQNKEQISA